MVFLQNNSSVRHDGCSKNLKDLKGAVNFRRLGLSGGGSFGASAVRPQSTVPPGATMCPLSAGQSRRYGGVSEGGEEAEAPVFMLEVDAGAGKGFERVYVGGDEQV